MKVKTKSPPKYTNKDGKARRNVSKRVLIGNIYGRGAKSIANQTGLTVEESKKVIDDFFVNFPRTREWMEESRQKAHELGYVEDCFHRIRHLPTIKLPKYQLEYKDDTKNFNPFICCSNNKIDKDIANKYLTKLNNVKTKKEFNDLKQQLDTEGITIIDNTGAISRAERQCVNFQCQAAGASLIKRAMINMFNDERLKKLGFELLLTVHDEVIGQCPEENKELVVDIIEEIMTHAGDGVLTVPMVCDGSYEKHWYEGELVTSINASYNKMHDNGLDDDTIFKQICEEHKELLPEQIHGVLFEHKDLW